MGLLSAEMLSSDGEPSSALLTLPRLPGIRLLPKLALLPPVVVAIVAE